MSLNINNYTIKELFEFLELNKDTSSFKIIKTKIDNLKKKVENNSELYNFLEQAEEKIKNYYKNIKNKIIHSGSKSFINNNLEYNNINKKNDSEENDSDENDSDENDSEENDSEENDSEENDNSLQYIDNLKPMKLLNVRPTKILKQETILNINTNNRIINTILSDNLINLNKNISNDSSHSFFKLPITLKNVILMKLIDIEIKYDDITVVSSFRFNNVFSISSEYISLNRKDNSDNKIDFAIYPVLNTEQELMNSIRDILDITNNKTIDLSFIIFDISYSFSIFDFTIFYSNPNNSNINFEIIFPDREYSLMSVLGFNQAKGLNKLYIDKNTIYKTIYGTAKYIIVSFSRCNLLLDHLYFALNENVQNSQNNNLLLVSNNQLSSYKILSKLTLTFISINSKSYGVYKLRECDVIKNYNNTRKYDGPIDINNFHINIVDDYGNKIFLNYNNFTFSILFKTLNNYIKNFENIIPE